MGRWLVVPAEGANFFLNSVPIPPGDFLTPDQSGIWTLLEQDGTVLQGVMARGQQPEEIEADSVRTIGKHLKSLAGRNATWLDWLDVVPLIPGMSEKVGLLPLDKVIRKLMDLRIFNEDGSFAENGGCTKPTKQDADLTTHQMVTDVKQRKVWLKVPVPDYFADWTPVDLKELWG